MRKSIITWTVFKRHRKRLLNFRILISLAVDPRSAGWIWIKSPTETTLSEPAAKITKETFEDVQSECYAPRRWQLQHRLFRVRWSTADSQTGLVTRHPLRTLRRLLFGLRPTAQHSWKYVQLHHQANVLVRSEDILPRSDNHWFEEHHSSFGDEDSPCHLVIAPTWRNRWYSLCVSRETTVLFHVASNSWCPSRVRRKYEIPNDDDLQWEQSQSTVYRDFWLVSLTRP